MALIVVSDIPLNGMLGEHPLQSELSFVEGHVKEVKKSQVQGGMKVAPPKEDHGGEEVMYLGIFVVSLLMIFLLSLGAWQLYGGFQRLKNPTKIKTPPSPLMGVVNMMICCGLFFMTAGGIYVMEGRAGAHELKNSVAELKLKQKQNFNQTKEQEVKARIIMQVYQDDLGRQDKGFLFMLFGVASLLGAWGSGRFRKD
jgi:hypothetical protein